MIRCLVFRPEPAEAAWPVADLAPGEWLWLDVSGDDVGRLPEITESFHFDQLSIDDAVADHLPMLDDYGSYLFVVLRGLRAEGEDLTTSEVDAFLGSNFLVTTHYDSRSTRLVWDQVAMLQPEGPDAVLAAIADAQSQQMLRVADVLDDTVFAIEARAISGDRTVLADIQTLLSDTAALRRTARPQRDVLRTLSLTESSLVLPANRRRFDSAFDHVQRLLESIDAARSVLAAAHDTYRSAVAEETNEVMRVLTVYSAILLPLTLLTGIYGMNFENMPELQWRYGYFALLIVMAAIAVGQWIYFSRRGFIGRPRRSALTRRVSLLAQVVRAPLQPAVLLADRVRRRLNSTPQPGDDSPGESG